MNNRTCPVIVHVNTVILLNLFRFSSISTIVQKQDRITVLQPYCKSFWVTATWPQNYPYWLWYSLHGHYHYRYRNRIFTLWSQPINLKSPHPFPQPEIILILKSILQYQLSSKMFFTRYFTNSKLLFKSVTRKTSLNHLFQYPKGINSHKQVLKFHSPMMRFSIAVQSESGHFSSQWDCNFGWFFYYWQHLQDLYQHIPVFPV